MGGQHHGSRQDVLVIDLIGNGIGVWGHGQDCSR